MKRSTLWFRKWSLLFATILLSFNIVRTQVAYYDIYVMDVQSGRVFQVSHVAGRGEYNPSWSPDGRFIVHDVVNPEIGTQSLGVTNVGTGETTMLQGGEGGNNASWSPNGEWIAFDNWGRIYVVPAAGGTPRFVVSGATPRWSNNSSRLVYEGPNGSIMTADLSGQGAKVIVPQGSGMSQPSWSPNGRWIVFAQWGNGPIYKVPVDELGQAQGEMILVYSGSGYWPTWSQNDKIIVFGSGEVLWSISEEGGSPVQLEPTPPSGYGDWDPAFSNSGQYVAFARYTPLAKSEVAQQTPVPSEERLDQNYPNPFNPTTTITYALPVDAQVSLAVYNTLGQKVAQLVDERVSAGYHSVTLDASQLASGVYLYRLTAGQYVEMRKMVLIR